MPIFEFEATDGQGKQIRGTVFGASSQAVEQELRKRGLSHAHVKTGYAPNDPLSAPVAVRPSTPPPRATPQAAPQMATPQQAQAATTQAGARVAAASAGVGQTNVQSGATFSVGTSAKDAFTRVPRMEDQYFFFRQMAALTEAGISLYEALESLGRQSRCETLRGFSNESARYVSQGGNFADMVRAHPNAFTPLQLALVVAGERGGFLSASFAQIAEYLDSDLRLRNLVRRVTFMPKAYIAVIITIVLFTNGIISRYGAPGSQKLWTPLLEPALWMTLGPVLLFLFWFFRYGIRKPELRQAFDSFVCYLPYIGTTMRQLAMARFGRAFGTMYKAAVPLPEALAIAAASTGNSAVRRGLEPAIPNIESGRGIAESLIATGMLEQTVVDMIATGERTGNLDQMLTSMASYYEAEAKVRSYKSAQVLGLVGMAIIGVIVFMMMLNFYGARFGAMADAANGIE